MTEVQTEIKFGRASLFVVDDFFKQVNRGKISVRVLESQHQEIYTEMILRRLGKGEASSIACAYHLEESLFASDDVLAVHIADAYLGVDKTNQTRIISLSDIVRWLEELTS